MIWEQHPDHVTAHATSYRKPSGEECRPARGACAGPNIEIGPFLPFPRHLIQMWCVDRWVPVNPNITISHIIGKDDHKFGGPCLPCP